MFQHTVGVPISKFSDRPNHLQMEGGALNAGYTSVDALAYVSNLLGNHGLIYRKDWWWEGMGSDKNYQSILNLRFRDEKNKVLVGLMGTNT